MQGLEVSRAWLSALGLFAARTAFRGSDLPCPRPSARRPTPRCSLGNVELCDITEALVFTDPYFDAEMNRHTTPQLDAVVAQLRSRSGAEDRSAASQGEQFTTTCRNHVPRRSARRIDHGDGHRDTRH
jgi:5-methylthioribose kinase